MPKRYQVLRNSANHVVRKKSRGQVRWVTALFLSRTWRNVFLLILIPLKLINTQLRKTWASSQHLRSEKSVSQPLDQSSSSEAFWPVCALANRAVTDKHCYTYIAICQNNFMSIETNKTLGLIFYVPCFKFLFSTNSLSWIRNFMKISVNNRQEI